jgi:predicted RNase H-like HicB family nuclease
MAAPRGLTHRLAEATFPAMKKKYAVTVLKHADGVSVSCPALPGCHSQGRTVKEALGNIREAMQGYLELYRSSANTSTFDLMRSRAVEQEVLVLIDEPVSR